jgi:uncharacterized membrane protein
MWQAFIIGPQLVGVVLLLVGIIQQRYQPKKINQWYGYRTPASMKNQQNWDEGNRYSAALMIKIGLILTLAGFVITLLSLQLIQDAKGRSIINVVSLIFGSMAGVVTMIVKTEKHLEKFEEQTRL